MKLYLCAIDIPDSPGVAFVRFAQDEQGARDWRRTEQPFQDTVSSTYPITDKCRCRIFELEAKEL
jgi:hypothetical protein